MLRFVVPTVGLMKDKVCLDYMEGAVKYRVLIGPDGSEFRARPKQLREPTEDELRDSMTADEYKKVLAAKSKQLMKSMTRGVL